jgi:hypothetical protein
MSLQLEQVFLRFDPALVGCSTPPKHEQPYFIRKGVSQSVAWDGFFGFDEP